MNCAPPTVTRSARSKASREPGPNWASRRPRPSAVPHTAEWLFTTHTTVPGPVRTNSFDGAPENVAGDAAASPAAATQNASAVRAARTLHPHIVHSCSPAELPDADGPSGQDRSMLARHPRTRARSALDDSGAARDPLGRRDHRPRAAWLRRFRSGSLADALGASSRLRARAAARLGLSRA